MAITTMVAKADELREDGKVFSASMLESFAKEAPDKYVYLSGPQELWLKKVEKDKKHVDLR